MSMTARDWLEAGGLGVVVLTALGRALVSMALRKRDRQDFELLRESCAADRVVVGNLRDRVSRLEGARDGSSERSTE